MADGNQLPKGFVLDEPSALPEGFVLDEPAEEPINLIPEGPLRQIVEIAERFPRGLPETALTITGGAIAEPVVGTAGLVAGVLPGEEGQAGETVEEVREALTLEPSTKEGREVLQSFAKVIQPIAGLLESAEKISGDLGFDIAGPVGGAIGATLPAVIAELLGLKGVRSGRRLAASTADEAATEIVEAGERFKVPVLTTDVQPPTTFLGKFTQQFSEKLGPLGTGPARADQQIARQNVVEELAKEFDVALDSPFADDIVKSLNKQSAKVLAKASELRNRAVNSLVQFGDVPMTATLAMIEAQIANQARLGDKANTSLVNNLESIKNSIKGDFRLVKDIRTEVIDDIKALARGEDRRATGALEQVKKAIDEDLTAFAKANDPAAAADWAKSNRQFAEEFGRTRNTELKRILNSGEATPELVLKILRGSKPSELKRLNKSLTPKGRAAARAAIVRDVLDESGYFRGDLNPDRLVNALNKTPRQQAIKVFFDANDKRQLDGLTRLLDATRRAQQAAAAPATGIQTIPLITTGGVGAGLATNPLVTMGTVGTLSGIAKAYESRPFRNLLLRISNSTPRSSLETGLLEAAVPVVLSGLQAAKERQAQTESTQQ